MGRAILGKKKYRVFWFDSGAVIEVAWHYGLRQWAACHQKEHKANYGYGPSRAESVRSLRKVMAAGVLKRMEEGTK